MLLSLFRSGSRQTEVRAGGWSSLWTAQVAASFEEIAVIRLYDCSGNLVFEYMFHIAAKLSKPRPPSGLVGPSTTPHLNLSLTSCLIEVKLQIQLPVQATFWDGNKTPEFCDSARFGAALYLARRSTIHWVALIAFGSVSN